MHQSFVYYIIFSKDFIVGVYLNLRTRDVSKTGDLIEFGHSSGVDYSRSAKDATAKLGKEVSDAVIDYVLHFIDEFVKFEFEYRK